MTATARITAGLLLVGLLSVGLVLSSPDRHVVFAHDQTKLVPASGSGRCPSDVLSCTESWTHVNSWIHYTARVPSNCAVEIIEQCGITVTFRSATSSCSGTNNCGHGPHNSTPRPTGPGTWTKWNGHRNINHRWSGQRSLPVAHDHEEGNTVPAPATPTSNPVPTSSPAPTSNPVPQPGGLPNFNPCANGGCLPPCMTNGIPGNCPWETPDAKDCTTSWGNITRQRLLSYLRWESIVPYASGFTGHHHPEVPGGRVFLTAASAGPNPARHWIARQSGTSLNVVDADVDGCLWTADAVGVSFRQLLPYEAGDLARLRSPGNVAAATEAQQAAALWDRLSSERRQWFQQAFPRQDPSVNWCPPADLPPWTVPADNVLSLSSDWEVRHGKCRWAIPRRGFWEWKIQAQYTSEQGDSHTETLASDLSWFREPTGYLGQQVTLW